jgi:CheY-like chemotaxis protein
MTILVVDDDLDARELAERILREHGASVIVAASAGEAIDMLHAHRPGLVLTDIGMPEMNGDELVRRLHAGDEAGVPAVPVIALTAYAREKGPRGRARRRIKGTPRCRIARQATPKLSP